MKQSIYEKTLDFVKNETEFHLGFLPTEQSNPKTEKFSNIIADNTLAGIDMLISIDEDMVGKAEEVINSPTFDNFVTTMLDALRNGGRIFFSGCGATGRLCILLDASWRRFWRKIQTEYPLISSKLNAAGFEDCSVSIMTGGDRALIRSVENFEDFAQFGRQQMIEKSVSAKDVVIAISEGGETSSVIGTAWQGVDVGASVFFVFNNPADILCERIERSRDIIVHSGVVAIDLSTSPMAIAGSTRMQATTLELLVIGAAVDRVIMELLDENLKQIDFHGKVSDSYAATFANLIKQFRTGNILAELADMIHFEESVYSSGGLVTYFADQYLLDILTDTTERSPTFRLPPFRSTGDNVSPCSWAFVKNPFMHTNSAWEELLQRPVDGLNWTGELYRQMGAPDRLCEKPPELNRSDICKFMIGNEDDPSRYSVCDSAAIYVLSGEEVSECSDIAPKKLMMENATKKYHQTAALCFDRKVVLGDGVRVFDVAFEQPRSPLNLWNHLALKLILNTVSTATMAKMGRVYGNWMVYVETSNKKLVDRAIRLIQVFTGLSYSEACAELFKTMEIIQSAAGCSRDSEPLAVMTIDRVKAGRSKVDFHGK